MEKFVSYKGIILHIVLIVSFSVSSAQKGPVCDCKVNFDSLRKSIEINYVGFENKVNKTTLPRYTYLCDSISTCIGSLNDYDCYLTLRKYLSFFNDPHLNIAIFSTADTTINNRLRVMFQSFEKLSYNEDSLKNFYRSSNLVDVEGIWKIKGGNMPIAIFRDKSEHRDFVGIAMNYDDVFWSPGQVKIEIMKTKGKYIAKYYKRDHYPVEVSCHVTKTSIILDGIGTMDRIYPIQPGERIEKGPAISFKKLSENSSLLTIPDFWITQKKTIDSIVSANSDVIEHMKYLILDLRNNGGGHIMSSDTLLPLIYTNPIKEEGLIVKSSPENIRMYKQTLNDENISDDVKQSLQHIIDKMTSNMGKLVQTSEGGTKIYPRQKRFPIRVGIIVNEGTKSAAELFLFFAKQSAKVVVFGANTGGALDYTEIGGPRKLPCPYLAYICPMGMMGHTMNPYIDNIGITPDVRIGKEVVDWVDYVRKYFERNNF